MELPYRKIPIEFLSSLPEGIKFANIGGTASLIVNEVCCPNGHSLMADSVKIHGEPSIRIMADTGASKGLIFVDPFWGGHEKLYNFIPVLTETRQMESVLCPECGVGMIVERECQLDECDCKRQIALTFPGGKNRVYVCANLGCPGHHMDIVDVPEDISNEVDNINYFGSVDDDLFQGI